MKKFIVALAIALSSYCSYAQTQWSTSGTNIYNANTGNVGIGTTAPGGLLSVYSVNAINAAYFTGGWGGSNPVVKIDVSAGQASSSIDLVGNRITALEHALSKKTGK